MEFAEFFRLATGRSSDVQPYDYQVRVAEAGLPDLIEVPTGAGKTFAAVGAWMYRRFFHPDPQVRAATPRRLVYALPMRSLVESVTADIIAFRDRLRLTEQMPVLQLMGGAAGAEDISGWRVAMDASSIVVGTVDQIVSRQLMRGYGASRRAYPIDFALVTNGAHVVVDEIQLAGQATSTTRQVAAFQKRFGTAEPAGLTCMSATVEPSYLDTVDNRFEESGATVVRLSEADRAGTLAPRLTGTRRIHRLEGVDKDAALADAVRDLHRPGTLTLVIVNRVDEAVAVHAALTRVCARDRESSADAPSTLLVHSRFRGRERRALNARLRNFTGDAGRRSLEGTPGTIIVATQAVEAGVDLDAATLVTEVAPWASTCQRGGRCNRAGLLGSGEDTTAALYWFDRGKPAPYEKRDVEQAAAQLAEWEGAAVTSEQMLGADVDQEPEALSILRAPTMLQLFDTSADLTGGDIDISRYIRADQDSDVQVAWVDPEMLGPDSSFERPDPSWRVAVPIPALKALFKRKQGARAWIYDTFGERWVSATPTTPFRPQDLVLVDRAAGGYDEITGFAPTVVAPVVPIHTDAAEGDGGETESGAPSEAATPTDGAADEAGGDPGSLTRDWQLLEEHLGEARAAAQVLQESLGLPRDEMDASITTAVTAAVHTHDLGKAFPGWQKALREVGTTPDGERLVGASPPEGLLAKGPRPDASMEGAAAQAANNEEATHVRRRLVVRFDAERPSGRAVEKAAKHRDLALRRPAFRHEVVSVLYLRSRAGRALLDRLGVAKERYALVDYLVGSHHGVLRVTPRDPVSDGRNGRMVFGVIDGERLPAVDLGDLSLPAIDADLSLFAGGGSSWGAESAGLLDEFGPFRLAYLEAVVRMSDWRASGAAPAAEVTQR